jgi:hypothetical protein
MNVGHENQPLYQGFKVVRVTATTTAAALPATVPSGGLIYVHADPDNSVDVTIGASGVTAGAGLTLDPGDYTPPLVLKNPQQIYVVTPSGTADIEIVCQY